MEKLEEKLSLLQELIAFALVDGELHDKEYDFLELISQDLGIEKAVFLKLFERKNKIIVPKDEITRICQFYRLALLMFCDGILHEKEQIKIRVLGIAMGLNPEAMKKVISLMEHSKNNMISPEQLLEKFAIQHN